MDVRTTKPISTISFNTPDYLAIKLSELTQAKILSFWAFIPHLPEDDEGGKKEHIHVYIEPSKMVQTDDIRHELRQPDPNQPDMLLGCLPFKSSNFGNWYLYGLHDPAYLASKGQSRKYHYKHEQIITNDPDNLTFNARSIDMLSISPYQALLDAQSQGLTFSDFFARGTVPLPQLALFERAWNLLAFNITQRNGHENHAMSIDDDGVVK